MTFNLKSSKETWKDTSCWSRKNTPRTLNPDHLCSNASAPSLIKENLLKLKAHIAPNTIIVGDFNTALSSMDQSGKQKLSRGTMKLTEALDELD